MDQGHGRQGAALSSQYHPQIDSLRAFAVLGVLYSHFWDESSPTGIMGVCLFFVISGCLITTNLVAARACQGPHVLRTFGVFYARRTLRIMPIYYVTLLIAVLAGGTELRETILWHAAYLSNILFFIRNSWEPWFVAHLWSLSVEEQFYLVWPLLMLLLPLRWLPAVALGAVALALASRALLWAVAPHGPALYVLTPAYMDLLAMGALLALVKIPEPSSRPMRYMLGAFWGVVFLLLIASALSLLPGGLNYVLSPLLLAFVFTALLVAVRRGVTGPVGVVLDLPVLRYIGKISYGIYLLHLFVLAGLRKVVPHAAPGFPLENGPLLFCVATALTIAVAAVSWHFFERPINGLKARFPYAPPREPAAAVAQGARRETA